MSRAARQLWVAVLFVLAVLALPAQAQVEPLDPATPGTAQAPADALASAAQAFYEQLGSAPAWIGHPDRLAALRSVLHELRSDGLLPEHYARALIDAADVEVDPQARASLDVRLTHGFLLALLHVTRGKLDPQELDAVWNIERRAVDLDAIASAAADAVKADRIDAFAHALRPRHPLYGRLRDALSRLHALEAEGGWATIGPGPTIEPGASDPRVPNLRRRLLQGGYLAEPDARAASDLVFDPVLQAAVRRFQEYQYLDVDGRVGRRTVAAMEVPIRQRIDQVRANLERGRWLLHELEDEFVVVDIAGYRLHFIQGGFPTFSTRVQVGQPMRRTPIFRARITHLTLNPAWIMPPTIYTEDALPEIRKSLRYLSRHHLRVTDADGNTLDPRTIDWREPPADLVLRQDPGPTGALGRIAIRFPNPYAVYLHETPHTQLFAASQRAFSSGCIRVEAPVELALLLLGPESGWTSASLDAAFATRQTQDVPLPRPVTILLMYWTTDVHPDGPLGFKPDVYGLDGAVLEALDRAPAGP